MSYRSQVAIAISKENYEVLKNFDEGNKNLREFLDVAEVKEDNNVVVIRWGYVKWFPEFPEIQAIQEFLCYVSDKNDSYRFIRLGEDIEDTEIETNYGEEDDDDIVDAIQIYRDIDINI